MQKKIKKTRRETGQKENNNQEERGSITIKINLKIKIKNQNQDFEKLRICHFQGSFRLLCKKKKKHDERQDKEKTTCNQEEGFKNHNQNQCQNQNQKSNHDFENLRISEFQNLSLSRTVRRWGEERKRGGGGRWTAVQGLHEHIALHETHL